MDNVEKIENVPNNSVYKVFAGSKWYIFKIYKQKHWPENGKLIFVNQKLIENDINCAKIIAFDRSDSYFNTGFLLEEKVLTKLLLIKIPEKNITKDLRSWYPGSIRSI